MSRKRPATDPILVELQDVVRKELKKLKRRKGILNASAHFRDSGKGKQRTYSVVVFVSEDSKVFTGRREIDPPKKNPKDRKFYLPKAKKYVPVEVVDVRGQPHAPKPAPLGPRRGPLGVAPAAAIPTMPFIVQAVTTVIAAERGTVGLIVNDLDPGGGKAIVTAAHVVQRFSSPGVTDPVVLDVAVPPPGGGTPSLQRFQVGDTATATVVRTDAIDAAKLKISAGLIPLANFGPDIDWPDAVNNKQSWSAPQESSVPPGDAALYINPGLGPGTPAIRFGRLLDPQGPFIPDDQGPNMQNQILIEGVSGVDFATPGDSGGPLLRQPDPRFPDEVQVVGIIIGVTHQGHGVATPIAEVLKKLKCSL